MFGDSGFRPVEFMDPSGYYALERVERRLGRIGIVASRLLLRLATNRWLARSPLNPHLFIRFERV